MHLPIFALAVIMTSATPAFAQEIVGSATVVDLTPLYDALIAAVGITLTAALGLAGRWFHRRTGIDLGLKDNAILNEAIERGLDFARKRAAKHGTIDLENELLATAARYAMARAPKAMKRSGISEAGLREMIEARLAPTGKSTPGALP